MDLAWTYSSLTQYETCPRRYYFTRVTKQIKEPPTEATLWGSRVHEQLEQALNTGNPLPKDVAHLQGVIDVVASKPGEKLVEFKMSVTQAFEPSPWDAAWCRGIVDYGVVGEKKAVLLDWKTGKRRPGSEQLALYAAMAFAYYPHIGQVQTGFVWVKENKLDKEKFTRSQASDIWQSFLPRVNRLEGAYSQDRWPPKPSGLCKRYCPVGKKLCEFCGN